MDNGFFVLCVVVGDSKSALSLFYWWPDPELAREAGFRSRLSFFSEGIMNKAFLCGP